MSFLPDGKVHRPGTKTLLGLDSFRSEEILLAEKMTRLLAGVNLIAFETRLFRTCVIFISSIVIPKWRVGSIFVSKITSLLDAKLP
mmetsp:Transcript_8461/g.10243  ORF Transcript_8461/g.10243 Transcript_8461/m.10243 type:complete len:86 (+) Transcript_8461:241-498(+)